jgi:exonuclease VII large subunit
MKDYEYILTEVNKEIKESLEKIESIILRGDVSSMEDYKFYLGERYALTKIKDYIATLGREDEINE